MAIEVYGAGGANKEAEQKTVTPTTSQQTVTPTDEDHELTQVTVEAMPSGALSDITVSAGRITAQVGTAGYLAAGTKKTKDLSKVSAQSYMPGTSDRVIISANQYTIGAQTLKGDANLLPENIKSGVTLFNVAGTAPKVTIDGTEVESDINLKKMAFFENGLPADMTASNGYSFAVTMNGDIYIIHANAVGKWNPESLNVDLIKRDTTKSPTIQCTPFVHDNKIKYYVQGNPSGGYNYFYYFDGTDIVYDSSISVPWSSYTTYGPIYAKLGNDIYVIGDPSTSKQTNVYKLNGTTWTKMTNVAYQIAGGAVIEHKGKLHIFGHSNSSYYKRYYTFNGTALTRMNDVPYDQRYQASVFILDDEIHIVGGIATTSSAQTHCKVSNDGVWTNLEICRTAQQQTQQRLHTTKKYIKYL